MIERLTRAFPLVLLVPAILPLIFVGGLLYPYIAPKTLLLRGLAVIAVALFAYLSLSGRSFFFDRLRRWAAWIPGVLLIVAYLSTALGANFYHGFWSTFDRGDGLLSLTAVVAFFYLILLYADERFFARFLKTVSVVGTLVAVYAVLQWIQGALGVDLPLVETIQGRIGSTLGNAAFLAGYLGMTVFVTLVVASRFSGFWRTFAYMGAALQLLAIGIAATRGTLLALALALVLTLIYGAVFVRGRLTTYARIALATVVVLLALFVVFRSELAQVPIESVQRLATISLSDPTVSSRLLVWKNMLPAALENPLLGTGAESIKTIFNRVYDPGKILEQWFDRSHNSFLDYFVQYGILGLALYLAVIGIIAYAGFCRYRNGEKDGLLFVLFALVYAVSGFFVFDTAVALWLLFALAALIPYAKDLPDERRRALSFKVPQAVPLVVGGVLLLFLIPVSVTPLRANLLLADGYRFHLYDIRHAVVSFRQGLALGTYADLEYGYQAYEMYTGRQQNMLSGEARVIAYEYARDVLEKDYAKYPGDARVATYFAHVLDSAPPEARSDESLKRSVLARAIVLSPKRAQAWYMLANLSLKKADTLSPGPEKNQLYREAISIVEAYAKMIPEVSEPRYILATLNLTINDRVSAKRWADEALPLYTYDGDLSVARRAARYYVTVGDWPLAERFLAYVVVASPGDNNVLYDFAKAAFLAGNKERGAAAAAVVKQSAPELFASDPEFVRAYEQFKK